MKWIDEYIEGITELCHSRDIFQIYDYFEIHIQEIDKSNAMFKGNEAIYIRDYFDNEVVFIKEDLPYKFKKFVLAHELAHSMLHVDLEIAGYNMHLVNKGKLERQADYFAFKLLNIEVDSVGYQGYTKAQIASVLYVKEECLEYIRR